MIGALLLALAASSGAQSFEAWSAKAEKAQKKGETEAAVTLWGDALRLWRPADGKSRRAKALAARGALFEKTGQIELAQRDLDEAVKNDSKNAKILDQRGSLHLSQNRLPEAMSDFYAATKLDAHFGRAFFHRAEGYERQGENLFAAEDYRAACRLGVAEACAKARSVGAPVKKAPLGKDVSGAPAPVPAAPAPEPPAAAETVQPPAAPPPPPAPVKKAAAPFKPSIPACRAALEACHEGGSGYGGCVEKAVDCETKPRKGCCPRDCLDAFGKQGEDASDSESFRAVFGPGGSCAATPR